MRRFEVSLLVLVAMFALLPGETFGRPFGRFVRRSNWTSTSTTATTSTVATFASATTETATTETTEVRSFSEQVSTATGVAQLMARYGRVGHFGGNPGYEGCGCGWTKEAAYNVCCYANSGMATVDVGYAQGSNGMWYCCRRYN